MADTSITNASVPRFRLSSIFLLFLCFAIGLATYPDILGAIGPALGTAAVVGLVQQTRCITKWQPTDSQNSAEISFARSFAVFWRSTLASIILGVLIWELLLSKGVITEPERESILLVEPLGDGLPSLCIFAVICSSLFRWRAVKNITQPPKLRPVVRWLLGIAITLVMLVEGTTIEFLSHSGMAGIESKQPYKLQRLDVYVSLNDEGYRPIYFGTFAVFCIIAAGVCASRFYRQSTSKGVSVQAWLLMLTLLGIPSTYSIWYYSHEFHRLSPELADSGFAMTSIDLAGGILIAAITITAGAYRFGRAPGQYVAVAANIGDDLDRRAFHESFAGTALFVICACQIIASFAMQFLSYDPMIGTRTFGRYVSMLCYPTGLLSLATAVASFQFVWLRWKKRADEVPEILFGLSARRFIEGGILLTLITATAIPALRAFAFTLWLGPWDLLYVFGLK